MRTGKPVPFGALGFKSLPRRILLMVKPNPSAANVYILNWSQHYCKAMATRGVFLGAKGVSPMLQPRLETSISDPAKLEALIYRANYVKKVPCSLDYLFAEAIKLGIDREEVIRGVNTLINHGILDQPMVPQGDGQVRIFQISAEWHKQHAKSLYEKLFAP